MLGSGTKLEEARCRVEALAAGVRSRVHLEGRVAPADVAEILADSGVFLMTSHAGYEGYPRVLVEAMASGLPAVVTEGSDTGGLVVDDVTGYTCGRDPEQLARCVIRARAISRTQVRSAVAGFDAPHLVGEIFGAATTGL